MDTGGRTAARARGGWRLLGVLVLLAAAAPIVHRYLVGYPEDQWQVDLEVYREAGRSLLIGRPLYEFTTEVPQVLPFTYPTFSALLATPLVLVPFAVAGWLWTAFQLALLWVTVGVAFRPLLERAGARAGLAQGLVAAGCVWISAVGEGIRFGQVNALLVALCLLDVVRGRDGVRLGRWHLRWPRGTLVGLAVAVKLTPGVFLVHFALTRQWRELRNAVAAAVAVTLGTFAVAPEASFEFWTSALFASDRLGPNAGSSNQSLRGFVLRLYLSDGATQALWLALVALAAVLGFTVARAMHRRGSLVGEVAACGLVAVLVSPVSWLHHLHWGVVVVAALVGDGRALRRTVVAAVALSTAWVAWPWIGANLLASGDVPVVLARVVQNGGLWWACLSLLALWRLVPDGRVRTVPERDEPVPAMTTRD
ncbi:glycosyltransferase 87 family protein [Kineococcus terrestris]|uniref:glycosyltransferase 87 family protein n=1 Tax=Kineococcus terrestris TaxID=2044856 RepID=UPI0034DB7C61